MTLDNSTDTNLAPNWRHVGVFLALTFGLTYLLDLAIYLRGGLASRGIVAVLQLQMLLPAFSAIALGLFFFPESPIYRGRPSGRGRWFYFYFLLLTVTYAVGALVVLTAPTQQVIALVSSIPLLLAFLGLLVLVVLRFVAGREAMARVWLAWGNWRYWLLFGVAIVIYYVLQAALNAAFGLGGARLEPPPIPPGFTLDTVLIVGAVNTLLLGPILGLVIAFGEEYGWRGYLQSELFKLGRVRGVLLLGVIWGAWHWPLILMGYNYPGHPLLGLVLMALYTTGLAIVLGYAVLKSGSVLLASYLHALNNQVVAFIIALGFRPFDNAFSFVIGIYGIMTLAVVALLILRDPVWRGKGSNPAELA
ncbi:MAG: CPBP family intramembrane glutamic endopeptidase [Rudaea sp.]